MAFRPGAQAAKHADLRAGGGRPGGDLLVVSGLPTSSHSARYDYNWLAWAFAAYIGVAWMIALWVLVRPKLVPWHAVLVVVLAIASGSVRAAAAIPPVAGSATSDAITGGSHSLSGRLDRARAAFSGTWKLRLAFAGPGGQTDECDSGVVRFAARL